MTDTPAGAAPEPYRMWAATAPFRRTGEPVIGTMGASAQRVIIMTVETFQRMLKEHPSLAAPTTRFELGEMDG